MRGRALAFAATEPLPHGVGAALEDVLAEHGGVTRAPTESLRDLELNPLLAFERGAVGFFESSFTRPFRKAAGRRGVRILGASLSHAPDPDVEVGPY